MLKFKELSLDKAELLLKLRLLKLGLMREELSLSSLVVFIMERSLMLIYNFIFGIFLCLKEL